MRVVRAIKPANKNQEFVGSFLGCILGMANRGCLKSDLSSPRGNLFNCSKNKLFPALNSYKALQYPPNDKKCDWLNELVNISVTTALSVTKSVTDRTSWSTFQSLQPSQWPKVWLVERVGQHFSHTTRQAEEDRLLWLLLQQSGALVNVHFETPPLF